MAWEHRPQSHVPSLRLGSGPGFMAFLGLFAFCPSLNPRDDGLCLMHHR